jgi:UDP:flavonoid glycosyltransferase YjiC (YdhE family)
MRFLFATWAWPSHLFPLVPFAWACRTAGHDVCIASQPALADAISRAGLPAVSVGRDMGDDIIVKHERPEITLLDPRTSDPDYKWDTGEQMKWLIMKTIFCRLADCMVDDLVEFARSWHPHLIVSDQTTFAGSVAAAAAGVPDCRLLYGPDITGPRGPELERTLRPPEFSELFARFSVEPRYDLANWTIDPCPPGMQTPTDVARIPMRYVPYSGGGTVPDWIVDEPSRSRICITWGTIQLRLAHDETIRVPQILDAVADLDVDVVVLGAGPYRQLLENTPPNVRVFDYVPLDLILPSCSVIIHQGGAGNMLSAAVRGVPQLLFPQVADQGIHSERLAATGAGIVLTPAAATADAIRTSVLALLGDSVHRHAAQLLRKEILEMPSPPDVVDLLTEKVRSGV